MSKFDVLSPNQLPITTNQRKMTDNCCTIISTIFALALFIYSACVFNTSNLIRITYPNDTDGRACGLDLQQYPYIYFTSPQNISKRLCINKCPQENDTKLSCSPTESLGCRSNSDPQFEVNIYNTTLQNSRLGLYCLPTEKSIRQKILKSSKLYEEYNFLNVYDSLIISFIINLVLGIIFVILVQYLPKFMIYVSIIIGGVLYVGFGILLIAYKMAKFEILRYIFGGIFIIVGILIIIALIIYENKIKICALFLKYSGNFISENKKIVFIIPIMIILTIGVIAVGLFQILACWSSPSEMVYKASFPLRYPKAGTKQILISALIFIQLYWALSFLKQASNLIITGHSINWFYSKNIQQKKVNSLLNVFCFHWGSIVAGSFMLGFFMIFDLIHDLFQPKQNDNPGCYARCCHSKAFHFIGRFFSLVRQQTMAYINLTGLAFCQASRYCQQINHRTVIFEGSQSVNRIYRLGAHSLLVCLTLFFIVLYMVIIKGEINIFSFIFSFFLSIFMVGQFINIHSDASQGILITFLVQQYLTKPEGAKTITESFSKITISPPGLVNELISVLGN